MQWYIVVIISILTTLLGLGIGIWVGFLRHSKYLKKLAESRETAKQIIEDANITAEKTKRDLINEAKVEIQNRRKECETDINERKNVVVELEQKLYVREKQLDNRSENLNKREDNLSLKEQKLEAKFIELQDQKSKVDILLEQQEQKLIEISNLTHDEAHDIIMNEVQEKCQLEIATYLKEEEEIAKKDAKEKAKNILSEAMQKYAADATAESTVSVVSLPSEEMKGRIIGREGRNIKAFEALTGVDLIIDDTPDAVVLSGFDPIRREVAKRALENLLNDGRIHPARIEEVVAKVQKEVEEFIYKTGDDAVYEMKLGKMNIELIKLVGRLNFRTSFGQNVLKHSMEVGFLAGKLAAELGENELLARRAGLLHDIGKSIDHEVEGSHVEIGVDLATRFKESKDVINAIASHHGDTEATSVISVLVAAADALSAARPGARNESVEAYIKRLQTLEEICNEFEGVKKSYAIQAGREIRVLVKPEIVDDPKMIIIAREIKEQIESKLSYPGTIKVTVIRETRVTDVAK